MVVLYVGGLGMDVGDDGSHVVVSRWNRTTYGGRGV
jgi:hypothetical protein